MQKFNSIAKKNMIYEAHWLLQLQEKEKKLIKNVTTIQYLRDHSGSTNTTYCNASSPFDRSRSLVRMAGNKSHWFPVYGGIR